ncbi:MAG: tRNA uridine(34) 5-carboxymethylaminomethyl modification radical SAM/GNAT enzyme Elp3 [Candidatus Altiarchaeota archaeon]
MLKKISREIIRKILSGEIKTKEQVDLEKKKLSEKFHLPVFIKNSDILKNAKNENEREKILKILQKKPSRTISGVAIVAVMTKPSKCPHGKCAYCPGGPEIGAPQSYTGKEPATLRALSYSFDPYLQVTFRLHQLKEIGHPIDKVELIVMGGTLTAQPLSYQKYFVSECLRAMNDFPENNKKIKKFGSEKFIENFKKEKKVKIPLEKIQKENENSYVRCVGMTFEPRPDYAKKEQINQMLKFGVTRVEIGVQLPFDSVYKKVNRGHTLNDVVEATQQLKDSGLKVCYHMMPGLIGKNFEKDLEAFNLIFSDQRFKPDMVKIYPCLILKGTEYYEMWKSKKFKPLETHDAVEEILEIKKIMPPWVRTMRIQRDIPSQLIEAGVKASNLGQIVYREMEKRKIKCSCIRCREVGYAIKRGIFPKEEDIEIVRRDYEASNGNEIFLSFEDVKQDILIGFLRLRIPWKPFRSEIKKNTALVRELHIYGPMLEIGEKPKEEWQHRGYGRELLEEAEKISSEEFDMKKILVTSGIGARNYYRKFFYRRCGVYMGKKLE